MNRTRALAQWDGPAIVEGVAWWTRLDDRYLIEVQGNPETNYQGTLLIWDARGEGPLLHQEETSISYGAIFGADVSDIQRWQERTIEIIDKRKSREEEGPGG